MKDTSKMAQWYQQTYSQQQGHFNSLANQRKTLDVSADADQSRCRGKEGFFKNLLFVYKILQYEYMRMKSNFLYSRLKNNSLKLYTDLKKKLVNF
jgi:hypothetical protein